MSEHRPSTTILPFPRDRGTNATRGPRRLPAERAQQAAAVDVSAWYHAAAVREAARDQQS